MEENPRTDVEIVNEALNRSSWNWKDFVVAIIGVSDEKNNRVDRGETRKDPKSGEILNSILNSKGGKFRSGFSMIMIQIINMINNLLVCSSYRIH